MARLRGVFFDLGGTLADIDVPNRETLRAIAARYGIGMPVQELERNLMAFLAPRLERQAESYTPMRILLDDWFTALLATLGRETTDRDRERFRATYLEAHRNWLTPYEGVAEALRDLRRLGLHVGLISDVDLDYLTTAVDTLGVSDLFDSLTASEEVGVGKPNPVIFRAALRKARLEPAEAAYVGDSVDRDVEGARAVGMVPVLVNPGWRDASPADLVVRSVAQVPAILEELIR